MSAIFLSYRRNDSAGEAGRLADEITRRLGARSVFMDVDSIHPGEDFRQAIGRNLRTSSVVLALIGPDWYGTDGSTGLRRIDEAGDYVRLELSSALQLALPVVPLLVRGARMPAAHQLPLELEGLSYRHGLELNHSQWHSDVGRLFEALARYLAPPAARPEAGAGPLASASELRAGSLAQLNVEPLIQELARYIGPIAGVLLKRALRQSQTAEELVEHAAREIAAPKDRERFLEHCTQILKSSNAH